MIEPPEVYPAIVAYFRDLKYDVQGWYENNYIYTAYFIVISFDDRIFKFTLLDNEISCLHWKSTLDNPQFLHEMVRVMREWP